MPSTEPTTRRCLILLLGALAALGPLSIDMYLPSFQAIERELRTTPAMVSGTMASYFVGLCLGQLFYGPWSDRVGRKVPLLVGISIYLLASLGCALSNSVEMLIALRFVQAYGACSGMVVGRAVVRDLFPPQETSKVFSLVMLTMGVSPIVAPLLGQLLAEIGGWRGNFAFMVLFAASVWLAVLRLLPWDAPRKTLPSGAPLWRRFQGVAQDKNFLAYALSGTLIQGGAYCYVSGSASLFMGSLGLSPKAFSMLFGLNASALIFSAQWNARLLDQHGYRTLLARSIYLGTAAGAVMVAMGLGHWGGLGVVFPLFVFMGCQGFIFPNSAAGALAEQGHQAGTASALLGFMQYGGAAPAAGGVGLLHRWTDAPMQVGIGACATASLVVFSATIGSHTSNDDRRHEHEIFPKG